MQSTEEQRRQFSIKDAYVFGEERGLQKEISTIRDMVIEWDSYSTGLKKGYLVELFNKSGLVDEFMTNYWPVGKTPWGEKECRRVLRIKDRYEAFLAGQGPELAAGEESQEEPQEVLFPARESSSRFHSSQYWHDQAPWAGAPPLR